MRRRNLLVSLSGGFVALAGCTNLLIGGCDAMHSTSIDVRPVTLSDEQLSHLNPLIYGELPAGERQVVEEAIGGGTYEVCSSESGPHSSFIDRARKHIDQQWAEYDGKPAKRPQYLRTAYLKRRSDYYAVEIIVEDVAVSG